MEACQKKSEVLLTSADKLATQLKEKQQKEIVKKNIQKLTMKKLEIDPYKMINRRNSWKGCQDPFLVGFEFEEWDEAVKGRKRMQSGRQKRRKLNRRIPKEHKNELDDDSMGENSEDQEDEKNKTKSNMKQVRVDPLMPTGMPGAGGGNDMMMQMM